MTDTVDKLLRCKKVIESLKLNSDNLLSINVYGQYGSISTIHVLHNAINWTGYVLERRTSDDKYPWKISLIMNQVQVYAILTREQLMDLQAQN